MRILKILLILIAPLFLVGFVLYTRVGPEGAGSMNDPDSYYIANGLLFAVKHQIYLMEHPGIPVSFLAGIFIWLRTAFFPFTSDSPTTDVLIHPDLYHTYLGNCALAMNALALFLFGLILLRQRTPVWIAVLAQWTFFLSTFNVVWFSGRMMPEGTALTLGVLAGIAWLSEWEERDRPIFLGFAVGLATNVKMNFLPYLLLVFTPRHWKKILLAIVSAALTFHLFTLLLPDYRRKYVYTYFSNMFLHSGHYGLGPKQVTTLKDLGHNAIRVWNEDHFAISVVLLIALLSLLQFAVFFFQTKDRRKHWLYAAAVLIVLGNIAATLKHPGVRYLFPTLVLYPAMFAVYCRSVRWHYALIPVLLLGSFVFYNRTIYAGTLPNLRQSKVLFKNWEDTINPLLKQNSECLILYTATTPSRAWSAFSGNSFAAGYFNDVLNDLYPNIYFAYLEPFSFTSMYRRVFSAEEFMKIIKKQKCMLFHTRNDLPKRFVHFFNLAGKTLADSRGYTLIKFDSADLKRLKFKIP